MRKSKIYISVLFISLFILIPASSIMPQAYYQDGGTETKSNQTYTASSSDESGILVTGGGTLTISSSTVITTGNTTSEDSSSFYGLNAGVLAKASGKITMEGCRVNTSGTGANGVFSTGTGTLITLINDTIVCTNDGGHGVDATLSGELKLTDVVISTEGAHGAAIATDRGGGTITVSGGDISSSGQDSPGIYSTGNISVSDAVITANGSEAAVIEGANNITLSNTDLTAAKGTRDRGLMIYQSMSGDAQGIEGKFSMTGGSFTWPSVTGPAFYVTNSTGVINLNNVNIENDSPTLIKASADQWGNSGSNGGTVILTAVGQTLKGNIVADEISSISATIKDSSVFTGAVNPDNTAGSVSITLDSTCAWTLTSDSYLNIFNDDGGIAGNVVNNITGNGHNIYYDASLSANSSLEGKSYSLINGGSLMPESVNAVDNKQSDLPSKWILEQNYPNPFNPVTKIKYSIPYVQTHSDASVRLEIFDLMGRKIAILVNEKQQPGNYEVTFNGSNLASGTYFYRLEAGGFIETKKMLLLK